MYVLGLIVCAVIIFYAGKRLSIYGDVIADQTGLGKAWIGLILMSIVTSLPELMVGISSVTIVGSADLAVGGILGSCALNLGILSIMDVFTPKDKPLFGKISQSHVLAAALSIILVSLVGIGLNFDVEIIPSIGIISVLFALVYFLSLRIIYSYNKSKEVTQKEEKLIEKEPYLLLKFTFFAIVIIITALNIPKFADQLAEETGLGKSLVGTLVLAFMTCLPEISISLSAVKRGSIDLAVGNLLGSIIFNIFILFIDDIFYFQGNLLADANQNNLISVFSVISMTAVAIIGIIYQNKRKKFFMAWDSFLIFGIYITNITILYFLTKS
jgi:cation:H+ antiporter